MCGIVGYIGTRNSQQILLNGLKKLEYRGYDSAGVAVQTAEGLRICKSQGRLSILENILQRSPLEGTAGIGHTRWATHGKPSNENSHPHTDEEMNISVVHNGIIENYAQLKEKLAAKGHHFVSETDTEVISHLIAEHYAGDIVKAVQQAITEMRGAFAIAVLCGKEPDKLVAVRFSSPLIIGVGEHENFIGSDIPALLEYTRNVYILNDGEMAVLTKDHVELMTIEGNFISRETIHVDWDAAAAEKDGFDHFMLKEIHEQPRAYADTMRGRISEAGDRIVFDEIRMSEEQIRSIRNIHITACGTAYHAGLIGKHVIEKWTRLPVEIDIASEYRYRDPIITPETLVIVVSQSGETADTLAALREAKRQGARVIAITNVVGSSVAREADDVIFTWAGPEISVASTKAYTSQLIAFYMLGLYLAQTRESLHGNQIREAIKALRELPGQVEQVLAKKNEYREAAKRIARHDHLFFIGRGVDVAVAQEGSLKLKEISYIHSEAYAAGELKHGTLALIEDNVPVIALATQPALLEKMVSNIREVKARGAYAIGVTIADASAGVDDALRESIDEALTIPATLPEFTPAIAIIPLQLFAYYAAIARGNDVDKPRNLAKSVTVE
ncbi:MAG TPA: glutamine--fructose-6-phosphate transaminase (isomerizing) [Bacilli bacterium]